MKRVPRSLARAGGGVDLGGAGAVVVAVAGVSVTAGNWYSVIANVNGAVIVKMAAPFCVLSRDKSCSSCLRAWGPSANQPTHHQLLEFRAGPLSDSRSKAEALDEFV